MKKVSNTGRWENSLVSGDALTESSEAGPITVLPVKRLAK